MTDLLIFPSSHSHLFYSRTFLKMRFSLTAAFVGAAALMSSVSADFYNRLNVDDAAFLFVDHQTGLLNLVNDYNPDTYLNNVMCLAESAKYFKSPVVLTTSREDGPNGVLLPELKALFPNSSYVARPGQINAWDSEEFRDVSCFYMVSMHIESKHHFVHRLSRRLARSN